MPKRLKVTGVLTKIAFAEPEPGILPRVELIGTIQLAPAKPKPRPAKS